MAHGKHYKTSGLANCRERSLLSQAELAKATGVHTATISRLETGRRGARPSTLRRLAEALGVEPRELLREPPASAPVPQEEDSSGEGGRS